MEVSAKFCFEDKSPYPPNNSVGLEYWLSQQNMPTINGREYLPITWTSVFKDADFGKHKFKNADITYYLDLKVDRKKKYYTVVTNDDGLFYNTSHLDIFVIGASGKGADYNIPLVCQPHPYEFNVEKDIFCSFIGNKTHPIRKKILELDIPDSYISSGHHNIKAYCEIMARSKFVLCPRGYGINSFRIAEAMQYGAIPVYISDKFALPYTLKYGTFSDWQRANEFSEYGLVVKDEDISQTPNMLNQFRWTSPDDIKWYYHTNYTYFAVKFHIINFMNGYDRR